MDLLEKENINPTILGCLMFIKLNTSPTEFVSEIIKAKMFEFPLEGYAYPAKLLEDRGFIKYITTGKKDPWYRIRLSDKGEQILKSLTQKPEHELAEECWNILKDSYTMYRIPKEKIVNQTKTTFYISEFLYEKEIQGKAYTAKMFKAVVCDYLNSLAHGKEHLAKRTLKLLYDPSNQYASKWNTEDSPLWNWSDQHKDTIINVYRNLK